LGENTATVQKEKATLKIKICMFYEQNAGKNHNIKKSSKSSKNVAEVQIFGNDTNKRKLDT
jgi:hypothetical protein